MSYNTVGIIKNGVKEKMPVVVVENIDASGVAYDNSNSGLSATRVQGAIDEVNAKVDRGSVSVTADGVKTHSAMLDELYALIDKTKINIGSKVDFNDGEYFHLHVVGTAQITLFNCAIYLNNLVGGYMTLRPTNSKFESFYSGSNHNISTDTPTSGTKYVFYY